MLDRPARNHMLETIDAYLHGRIKAFEFDRLLHEGLPKTSDRTVHTAVVDLWLFYDDIKDHTVVLRKESWDYIQRVRLLLASDAECQKTGEPWQWRQLVALCGFIVIIADAFWSPDIAHWMIYNTPISALVLIWMYAPMFFARPSPQPTLTLPFESLAQLRQIRRLVPGFKKERYPSELKESRIRNPMWAAVMLTVSALAMLLIAPMPLLIAAFPLARKRRIVIPSRES